MKKRLRRAFSIIELVIVIAIIAILAAVLIPTFANVVHKANESADVQVARQLNTLVTAERPTTYEEFSEAMEKNGIELENCTPIVSNTSYYWVIGENKVVYYRETDGKVLYPEDETLVKNDVTWIKLPQEGTQNVVLVSAGSETKVGVTADNAESTPVSVTIPAGATDATALKLVVEDKTPGGVNLLGNNLAGSYAFGVSLIDQGGNNVTGTQSTVYTVTMQLPQGLTEEFTVMHETTPLTQAETKAANTYTYDFTTGNLAIYTNTFSPFSVSWNKSAGISFSTVTIDDKYKTDSVPYGVLHSDGPVGYHAAYEIKIDESGIVGNKKYETWYIELHVITEENSCSRIFTTGNKPESRPFFDESLNVYYGDSFPASGGVPENEDMTFDESGDQITSVTMRENEYKVAPITRKYVYRFDKGDTNTISNYAEDKYFFLKVLDEQSFMACVNALFELEKGYMDYTVESSATGRLEMRLYSPSGEYMVLDALHF